MSDLARRMGIVPSLVSRWVSGGRIPSPDSCDLLADALGIDIDRVLVAAGHRPNIEAIPVDDDRATIAALLRQVELTPDRGALLKATIRAWLELDRQP